MTLPELLKSMVEMDGSDLHITTDSPPAGAGARQAAAPAG